MGEDCAPYVEKAANRFGISAKIKKTDNTRCWWGCGTPRAFMHAWWEGENGKATLENSLTVSYKNLLIHEPAILLLGIYLQEMQAYVSYKTCMCIVAACI